MRDYRRTQRLSPEADNAPSPKPLPPVRSRAARVLQLQRQRGNRAVQRYIQRNPPGSVHSIDYEPVKDTESEEEPFKLALSRNMGGHSGLLKKLTKGTGSISYKDIEAVPSRFGVEDKPSDTDYLDYLTDYLMRSMLTATDVGGGGIILNLAGYTKATIGVIVDKYNQLLEAKQSKDPSAKYLTHKEFKGSDFTKEELEKMPDRMPSYTAPGYTDWELATALAIPEVRKGTIFVDVADMHESGYTRDPKEYEEEASMYKEAGFDPEELIGKLEKVVDKEIPAEELASKYGIT